MPTNLVKKHTELVAMAAAQRKEIADQLAPYRDVARIVEKGYTFYRILLPYKLLFVAGITGFAIARPRRVLRFVSYGWSLYKMLRSAQRLLKSH